MTIVQCTVQVLYDWMYREIKECMYMSTAYKYMQLCAITRKNRMYKIYNQYKKPQRKTKNSIKNIKHRKNRQCYDIQEYLKTLDGSSVTYWDKVFRGLKSNILSCPSSPHNIDHMLLTKVLTKQNSKEIRQKSTNIKQAPKNRH